MSNKRKGRPPKKKAARSGRDVDARDEIADVDYLDEESDHSFDDDDLDLSDAGMHSPSHPGKKRGRPKAKDERPKKLIRQDSESDIDEMGEKKIDRDGHLLDGITSTINYNLLGIAHRCLLGRQYRVPTFELPDRGNMLFMFSKDPAALLGFRDSFVFLKKNPKLVKVHVTDGEKGYLVEMNLLRSTFRTREVSVVTARSVFKQFGHRVLKKGRRGRDDYYYTGEVDEDGDGDGNDNSEDDAKETADKSWSPFALSGRNNITNKRITSLAAPITDVNWMHHVAMSIRDFNAQLCEFRRENPTFYDIHTNVHQIPSMKQPKRLLYRTEDQVKKELGSSQDDKKQNKLPGKSGHESAASVPTSMPQQQTAQQAQQQQSQQATKQQQQQQQPQQAQQQTQQSQPSQHQSRQQQQQSSHIEPHAAVASQLQNRQNAVPNQFHAGYPMAQARFNQPQPATDPNARKMAMDNAAAQQMYYQMALAGNRPPVVASTAQQHYQAQIMSQPPMGYNMQAPSMPNVYPYMHSGNM
ncbi:hypothetical protein EC973_002602 [Apophysomyces ossiformis]|uniref:Uncharacterized protein n=1 Tax=Apophysomyces ossiformis TaxID=679940 RepID=A0A8H7BNG4_9FUNG|nr:hypothetical protein EC973_002602 [Apophysomyces ossiformis]